MEHLQINVMCFHAAFNLFHICICNRFEIILVSYRPNNLE
jgi:hypothetical protein